MREVPVRDRLVREDAVAGLVPLNTARLQLAHPLVKRCSGLRPKILAYQFDMPSYPAVVVDLP